MPLEDILNKIRDESSRAVREIVEDAEVRAQKRVDEAKGEAQSRASIILEDAKTQSAKVEAMARTRSDANRRQLLLKEKQALIETVFDKASKVLASLPANEYRQMMLDALANSAAGDESVVFGSEDMDRLGGGFADDLNSALSARGKVGAVKVRFAEKSLGGGYLLQSGGVSENSTFPALMNRFRDELEIEVARKLFSQ